MIRNGEKKGEEQLEENASKLIFFPSACSHLSHLCSPPGFRTPAPSQRASQRLSGNCPFRGADPGRHLVCCKTAIIIAHPHPDGGRLWGQPGCRPEVCDAFGNPEAQPGLVKINRPEVCDRPLHWQGGDHAGV